MTPYYSLLVAVAVTLLATAILLFGSIAKRLQDVPNERSLHAQPVPRSGGIAILLGIAVGWGLLSEKHGISPPLLWTIFAAVPVAGISLLDDLYEISPRVRLPVHLLAAVLVLLGSVSLPWGVVGWVISLFAIVWMLNLYNFMDGMDGFAGGMTLFGFGFLGWAGWLAGDTFYAYLCWTVAASTSGFLAFNFPPARIFMGDTGSATLGVLAASFSFWGYGLHLYPLWFPVIVFSPFVVDATVTLIRRGLRGERVWQAHREHYYQRLVQSGWSHRQTVLVEYGLMALVGGSGIWTLAHLAWSPVLLISWIAAYVILMLLLEKWCGPVAGNDLENSDHLA